MYPAVSNRSQRPARGFTLLELILVLVLVGITAALATVFIVQPFQAALDIERRAVLVDAADLALDRMVREVHAALPNSVRTHSSTHFELIATTNGGRYPVTGPNRFNPGPASGDFEVLGGFPFSSSPDGSRISSHNTGQPGLNAYAGESIADITGYDSGTHLLSYENATFSNPISISPQRRFYVFSSPVSFVCDNGELRRYSGYPLTSGTPSLSGGELVADNVSSCDFQYQSGSSSRRGLLTMEIGISGGGENISLLAQAQVINSP